MAVIGIERSTRLNLIEAELRRLYLSGRKFVKARDISVGLSPVVVGKYLKDIENESSKIDIRLYNSPSNNSANVYEIREVKDIST